MKRKIPVSTNTFTYFNANPKGKSTGDCVIRAISTALHISWEDTIRDLTEFAIKKALMPNDPKLYGSYLESKGFYKKPQPRKYDNTKYTGKEWCECLSEKCGDSNIEGIVAHVGGHHTVYIGKTEGMTFKIWDTWNSTDGCIGNYWVKYKQ